MERLWGEVLAGAGRIASARSATTTLTVVGHTVDVAKTPGHASHHVSYFLPDAGVAFVGDTAGLCRSSGRIVLPATPPPDIDLDAWRASTQRILAWHPDVLFLTHFGPHRSPRGHFSDLWSADGGLEPARRAQLQQPGDDEERARVFSDEVMDAHRARHEPRGGAGLLQGRPVRLFVERSRALLAQAARRAKARRTGHLAG